MQQSRFLHSRYSVIILIALCVGLLAPFTQIEMVAAAASITISPQAIAVGNPGNLGVQIDGNGFQGGATSTATVQLKSGSTVLLTQICNIAAGIILNTTNDKCDYTFGQIAGLAQGTYTITVSSNNTSNTASGNLYITGFNTSLALTTSASNLPESGSVTLTATLTNLSTSAGISGKLITFSLFKDSTDQEVNIVTATTNASGVASVTINPINNIFTGGSTVTAFAKFLGDSTTAFARGTAALTINRRATTTTVSCSPATITVGGSATTCTATVTDVDSGNKSRPDGTVVFTTNGSGTFGGTCNLVNSGMNGKSCNRTYTATGLGTGTHQITASYSSTGTDSHANSSGSGNVTVSSGTATMSVTNTTQTYNGSPRPVTVTTNPAGLSGVSVTYNGSTTVPTNAGTYAVVATLTNPSYTATPVNATLTVNKASATMSLSNTSQTYDGNSKSVTVTTNPAGLSGVAVTYNGSSTAPTNVGSYAVVASLTNANYTATSVNGTLTITKATPVINWSNPAAITYGTALSATELNATVTPNTAGTFTYTPPSGTILNVGSYTLQANFAPSDTANYNSPASKTVTINVGKASQTISFGTLANKTYLDADFTVSANASSGLAVSFAASGNCTLTGNLVHLTGAGSCTITASQAGDSNYNPAPSVDQSFNISKAAATVSLTNLSQTYTGSALAPTATTTPPGLTVSFSYIPGGPLPSNAGSYSVTATVVDNNYQGSATETFVITKADQTITFNPIADTIYGVPAFPIIATSTSGAAVTFTTSANCSEAGSNISILGAGPCTVTASQAGNGNYNPATDVVQTFNIAKAPLVVHTDNISRLYGQPNPAFTGFITGLVYNEPSSVLGGILTHTTSPLADETSPVGTYTIIPSGLTSNNYEITFLNGTLTITQTTPVITWNNPADISFGTPLSSVQLNATASTAGTFAYTPDTGAILNMGNAQTLSVLFTPTDSTNYISATKSVLINVVKANQTITFNPLDPKTYGDAPFTVSATASSGLPVSFSATGSCTVSGNIVTITGASNCTVTASQAGDSNYNPTTTSQSVTIAPAALTVTANAASRIYSAPDPAFSVSYSGFVYGETAGVIAGTLGFVTSASAASPVGNNYTITPSGLTAANYTITFVDGTLTINKADTTTLAVSASNIYDPANAGVTLSATVTANAPSTATVNEGVVEFTLKQGSTVIGSVTSGNVSAGTTSVSYAIPGGTTSGSYSIEAVYVPASSAPNFNSSNDTSKTLAIGKANQIITFGTLADKTYLDPDFMVSATASSGLVVNFAATGNCTVLGNMVSITGAGSCTITASQPGDGNYNPATDVSQSFNIAKATPVITWVTPADIVYGTALSAAQLNATASTAGMFAYSPDAGAILNAANAQTLSVTFTPSDTTNFMGATKSVLINVLKANQTITFGTLATKTYGNPAFTVSGTATSGLALVFSSLGNCSISGDLVTITGAGGCTITASQAGDSNYNAAVPVDQIFTINPAALTVTADNQSKVFGEANPTFTVSYNGFVYGETTSVLIGTLSFATSAAINSPVGSYSITPGGLTAANYTITFVDGTLTINRADTTTVAVSASATYNPANSSVTLNATVSSNMPSTATVNEGTVEFTVKQGSTVIGSATSSTVSVGAASVSYAIPGGTVTGGYSIEAVYVPATIAPNFNGSSDLTKSLGIGKANQTISFAALADKIYLDPAFTVSATASSGLAITFAATGNCSVFGDSVSITGAGSCTITASQPGDSNYNPATDVSQSFNIAKATPVITWATPADIVYGTALSVAQLNATASTAGTFAYTPDFGAVLPGGNGQILAVLFTPTDSANYTTATKSVSINVLKADQTITFNPLAARSYGDPAFTVSATASSGLNVSFAASAGNCTVLGNLVAISGAGSCTVTASQAGDGNFNPASSVPQTFSIAKATLIVAANGANRVYSAPEPTFSVNYSGFVYSDNASGLSGLNFIVIPAVTAASPVGGYTIMAYGLSSPDYTILYAPGTLTINKATTSVSATSTSVAFGSTSVTLSASVTANAPSSAIVNEGSVEFTVKQGNTVIGSATSGNVTAGAASVSYPLPAATTVDTYTIVASYVPASVAPNFNGSSDTSHTLAIGKATQTITFAPLADKTFGNPDFSLTASASSGLTVSFAATGNCTATGNTVTMTGTGNCTITASQAGDTSYFAATDVVQSFNIAKATATITLGNLSQTYDGTAKSATASTNPAGLTVTLTYDGSSTAPINAGSYAIVATIVDTNYGGTASDTLIIGKANQSITFGSLNSKTYGDPAFTVSGSATSGLALVFTSSGNCAVSGDSVTITGAGGCTITASQPGANNYNAAIPVDQIFTISPAALTATAENKSKLFGEANPIFTVNYLGFVYGETASVLSGTASFATSAGSNSPVGSYSITPSGLSSSNYSITFVDGTLTINKANTTTSAVSASVAFGATSVTLNATVTANAPSSATVNEGSVEFTVKKNATTIGSPVSGNVSGGAASVSYALPTNTPVDSYTIVATYVPASVAPNFNGSSDTSKSLGVGKATQTITFGPLADKTFGNPDFNVVATASSGLSVSFAATGSCSVTGSLVHLTGAGSCNVTASQAGDSNYSPASEVAQSFNIAKATATITLGSLSQTYDGTAKSATATTNPASLTVTFTYDGSTTAPINAGSYAVVGTIVDANYLGTASDTLVIGKTSQTITFGPLANKTFGDADFTVSATASSGLSISFAATGSCTVAGNSVHLTGAGSCTITASQAGNGNYNAASEVAQSFSISQGTATVNLSNLNQVYNGTARAATATTVPAGLTVNLTYDGAVTVPTNAGSYAVVATIVDATYTGSASGTLVIAKATPVLTWNNPADITYGTALSATQLNATASTAGTFVYSPLAGTVLSAGNGQNLSVSFTPTNAANYTTATKSVTINLLKAALTITANNKSRNYLVANPTFDATYSGFVNGDTATSLSGTLGCTTTATQSSAPGTYPITCAGQSSNNYTITYVPGTLTVLSGPDNVAPTTVATRNPLPNAAGWNNTNVTITLNATDNANGSGVKQIVYSATGAQTIASTTVAGNTATFVISTEGTTTISFFARDNANNTETTKTLTIKLDKTAPPVNISTDCTTPDGNWHTADETVWCSINSPNLVGPSNFTLVTSVPAGTETANAYTNSKQVCDVAGNCVTVGPVGPHKIDKKAPTITITAPTAANYKLGQVVKANFACVDGGSGVASCNGDVANNANINTSSVGTKTFKVTAEDNLGNKSTKTVTYTVSYNVSFVTASPVPAGTPIRIQLLNANNANVSAGNIAVTALTRDGVAISGNTAFSFSQNRYNYTVNTTGLSSGVHTLTFKAGNDPTIYTVQFIV